MISAESSPAAVPKARADQADRRPAVPASGRRKAGIRRLRRGPPRPVPGLDVPARGLPAQGYGYLLAPPHRPDHPTDRPGSAHRPVHLHARNGRLDRPALGLSGRRELAVRARRRRGSQPGQVHRHLPGRADPRDLPSPRLADLADARRVAPRAPGARRPHVRPSRDALAALSLDLPRRADPMGPPSGTRGDPAVRPGGVGQLAWPVRARADHPGHGDPRRRGPAGLAGPGSEAMVANRRHRHPGDVRRLPGQSLWDSRGHLSDRARRDDDEPRVLAQHRRIDTDPGVHPASRARQSALADPPPHDGCGCAELPRATSLVARRRDSRAPGPAHRPMRSSRPPSRRDLPAREGQGRRLEQNPLGKKGQGR